MHGPKVSVRHEARVVNHPVMYSGPETEEKGKKKCSSLKGVPFFNPLSSELKAVTLPPLHPRLIE